jgi:outer membrane protein W
MKKNLFFALFALVSSLSNAQSLSYRRFKVDVTTGYSKPAGGLSGGFNLSIEPKFNLTDQVAVGIKIEGATLATINDANSGDATVVGITSTLLTGEYYLGSQTVRPYVGIGTGIYRSRIFSTSNDLASYGEGGNMLGIAPRVGLQLGHFRLGVEYNIVRNNNYFSAKLGTTFGGGRKNR